MLNVGSIPLQSVVIKCQKNNGNRTFRVFTVTTILNILQYKNKLNLTKRIEYFFLSISLFISRKDPPHLLFALHYPIYHQQTLHQHLLLSTVQGLSISMQGPQSAKKSTFVQKIIMRVRIKLRFDERLLHENLTQM